MKSLTQTCLLALFLQLLSLNATQAGPGDLDTTFNGTGTTRIGFGGGQDFGRVAAVQADGKVVLAGTTGLLTFAGTELAVVRYDTNNVLDPTFAAGGKLVVPVSNSTNNVFSIQVNAIQVQPDNKIALAGSVFDDTNTYSLLVRLNPDGSFDNSFGANGIVTNSLGLSGQANALVIQPDGKYVLAGSGSVGFAVARLNTNGTPDLSFAGTGLVTDFAGGDAGAYGVTLQSDLKIVAVGTGGFDLALIRYTTNGVLDTSFGTAHIGKVFTHAGATGSLSFAAAVAIDPGDNITTLDRIVIAGTTEAAFPQDPFVVCRYNLNGTLDTSFNGTGMITTQVGPNGDFSPSLLIQGTGSQPRKIIVAGAFDFNEDSDEDFCVIRYTDTGALDSTFGGSGIVTTSFGPNEDAASGMTFVPGNKLLVVGSTVINSGNSDFAMARYNLTDGSLDTTYNGSGKMTLDIWDRTSQAAALAIQSDGSLVVAGSADNGVNENLVLTRFKPDGSLDTSFAQFGKAVANFGGTNAIAHALVIQPDGKILAAGSVGDDFAILRFNPNGTLDNSFNSNGIVTTPVGASGASVNAVALQTDGRIVAAGSCYNGSNDDFAVVRYNTNGTLDTNFGTLGKVTTAIDTGEDIASGVKIQTDGKIVVAGYAAIGNTSVDFAAVRYTTNGVLDTSFGTFGRAAIPLGSGGAIGSSMAIQSDGKILIAGYTATGSGIDFGLVRLTTNGLPDSSFNGNGKVITPVGLSVDAATAVALQVDGKIIVAGYSVIGAHDEFVAVRYHTDGSLDSSYGAGGAALVDFEDNDNNMAASIAVDSSGRVVLAGQAGGLFAVARLQGDPTLKITSLTRLPNGHAVLTGVGFPNANHTLQGSTTAGQGSFAPVGQVITDGAGNWQYDDATAVSLPRRFYRLKFP